MHATIKSGAQRHAFANQCTVALGGDAAIKQISVTHGHTYSTLYATEPGRRF